MPSNNYEQAKSENSESEKFITNDRGIKLFCKYWWSENQGQDAPAPRALLFIAHGLAEHCLYYEEIATMLTKDGFYVFAHDHQGHGQSAGSQCMIGEIREFSTDIFMHIDLVKEHFPDLPVFLLGHSMGGAISIISALDRPDYFKGVALLSPLVTPDHNSVGACRIFFGKLVARLCPQFPVMWLASSGISRDPAVCKKYEDDPLNYHGGIKAKMGLSLLSATQEIATKLDTVTWPFYVVHGSHDEMVPPNGSRQLFEKAKSSDKTFKIYQDCFHQIHQELEPNKSEMLEELRQWLCKRVV